jgi:hypothetical protein
MSFGPAPGRKRVDFQRWLFLTKRLSVAADCEQNKHLRGKTRLGHADRVEAVARAMTGADDDECPFHLSPGARA